MKTYIHVAIFLIISMFFFSSTYANSDAKTQILALNSGQKLIERIDSISKKIVQKTKTNSKLHEQVLARVEKIQNTYKNKTSTKSKQIVLVFEYLESQIRREFAFETSPILQRIQKIEIEKYKKKSVSRVNKVKKKRYERVHIKK